MSDNDLKAGDVIIAWNNMRESRAIIGILDGINMIWNGGRFEISHTNGFTNAKWDGTQNQYEYVRSCGYTRDKLKYMLENTLSLKIDGEYYKISDMVCPKCEVKMKTISISTPTTQPVIVHGHTEFDRTPGLLVMECLHCRTKYTYQVDDIKKLENQ